jgi:hypothetical protein
MLTLLRFASITSFGIVTFIVAPAYWSYGESLTFIGGGNSPALHLESSD